MSTLRQLHGFNLFELLITMTLISILMILAVPAYTKHLTHEHRIEAEIALEKLAASLEQYNTLNNTYQNATLSSLGIPEYIAKNTYQLKMTDLTDTDFLITATPQNDQAQKDTLCGTLILKSSGEKGITGEGNSTDCW